MNEEEMNKMCSDIYEGEDWQPMKDYIKSLQTQLQQKENIIKEVREYIERYEVIFGYYDANYDGISDTYSHNTVKEDLLKILDKENK